LVGVQKPFRGIAEAVCIPRYAQETVSALISLLTIWLRFDLRVKTTKAHYSQLILTDLKGLRRDYNKSTVDQLSSLAV
jgi:hypothetical protein